MEILSFYTCVPFKWQSYDLLFLRYGAWWTEFFVILDHFLLFYPPKNLKNQNFEKMKKNPDDIIILQKCTKNHDHIMLYCSWDVAHDGCDYFSFWAIFCPVTPLTASKMKISKKQKQYLEIPSFYTSVPKIMVIWYTVPGIWHMMHATVLFPFGLHFGLSPPTLPEKWKFQKNEKPGDTIILHMCTKNYDQIIMCCFWDMVCNGWMDRWTDGKSNI